MLRKNSSSFPRILVNSCTKCGGALREQEELGEWMCINCGILVLEKTVEVTQIKETGGRPGGPSLPGEESRNAKNRRQKQESSKEQVVPERVQLKLPEEGVEEEEGDDQEWSKLVTFREGQ